MKSFRHLRLAAMLLIIAPMGCDKDNPKNQKEESALEQYVESMMIDHYFWHEEVPSGLSMDGEEDVFNFFDALLYEKDKWSTMMTGEDWNSFEMGAYTTFGASLSQAREYYGDYSVKVRYVFPDSPLGEKGVKRGWTITHVGGEDVRTLVENGTFLEKYKQPSNTFTFKDNLEISRELDVEARGISIDSYLLKEIYTSEDFEGLPHAVGYFNYLFFNYSMQRQIDEAFAFFKAAGVKDLILDLRYNGGGDIRPMTLLANYLAPISAQGEVLAKKKHNDKNSNLDEKDVIIHRKENAVNLNRIFVITGSGSASASEVLINGLKPFYGKENIIHVGDTTYGKPNGMYAFPFPEGPKDDHYAAAEYVFLPICFLTVNRDGEGDFEDGIIPMHYRPDDLYNDWGVEEDLLKACLTYISEGKFPKLPDLSSQSSRLEAQMQSGRLKIKTIEDAPGYGWYIDRLD